jgi:hypothetical protein
MNLPRKQGTQRERIAARAPTELKLVHSTDSTALQGSQA